ncbi:calretinin-like [Orbicella faveolata]|uniref:calretinin-like n=1 Tax=Orbicella faveolata TaxID=48498 RepID=UPI0009E47465|nr:calretinin-like [Orbicella faveolata]
MASENIHCITSKQFVTILKIFDKDGNGHIVKSELDAFLKAFEDEGLIESSRAVEIAEKIREQQDDDEELVTMTTLANELVPVNFLTAEFGEQQTRITSVDFMKLWDHYDADGSGYLDCIELKSFFRDILTRNRSESDAEDPDLDKKIDRYVKTMFEMQHIKGEKVSLEEMCKFCPVEENFLEQYETFTDEEFEEIFAHYDQASLCGGINLIDEFLKIDRWLINFTYQ